MKKGYDVYLDKCLLPVAPARIKTKIKNANDTVTLINEGEINLLKNPGLTEIEFEFLIPAQPYPFASYADGFRTAGYYLDCLERLKLSRQPFSFIVSRQMPGGGVLPNTNMRVSLENYEIAEDAEEGFDLTVNVKLKQYREYGTKTVNITLESVRPRAEVQAARPGSAPPVKTYKVEKGDCLSTIARRLCGKASAWRKIYEANRSLIGGNPDLIFPGQVLSIP